MTARRTQAERTAATRDALVLAARGLFATRGYADVSTPEIAAAAAVTRGALYHQLSDKRALFHAVVEAVEVDVMARLATTVTSTDPMGALLQAARAWIALAGDDAEVRRVLLVDAPSVLGWAALRDIAVEHGLGLTEQLLSAARPDLPSRTAAHLVLGALNEAAFLVADGECSVDEASAVLEALIRP
jgi:AcrR family transcriptional regulator